VVLEKVLPRTSGKKYPRCTAGERAGPPDDCGGVFGYQELMEILADPTHEEHKASHRWAANTKGLRDKFDPAAFDEQGIKFNDSARRLKKMLVG
jgi:hypothetical protein